MMLKASQKKSATPRRIMSRQEAKSKNLWAFSVRDLYKVWLGKSPSQPQA
jgi:hypothetical protein